MPTTVAIPEIGEVDFPDGMTDEQITAAIEQNILPRHEKGKRLRAEMAAEQSSMRLPEKLLGGAAAAGEFAAKSAASVFDPGEWNRGLQALSSLLTGTEMAPQGPTPPLLSVEQIRANPVLRQSIIGTPGLDQLVSELSTPENAAALLALKKLPATRNALLGTFAMHGYQAVPEVAAGIGSTIDVGTDAEKLHATALAPLTAAMMAGGIAPGFAKTGVKPRPEFAALPDPDVVARGAAAPRDVALAGERVGVPKNQIAGEAPVVEMPEGMLNFDLPYRELRASAGRQVRFEDAAEAAPETRRAALEAEGKLGFQADAPAKTSNVPDRTADAIAREKAAADAALSQPESPQAPKPAPPAAPTAPPPKPTAPPVVAEPPKTQPVVRRTKTDRPWDILDEIEANVGRIRGKKTAKPGSEGYYGEGYREASTTGFGRKLFSNAPNAQAPDLVVDALRRSGVLSEHATVDDLYAAMTQAAKARKSFREGTSKEAAAITEAEAQRVDFENAAFEGARARKEPKPGETLSVNELFEGDEFSIAGEKVRVKELVFDRDSAEIAYVVLDDGRRFETQMVGAEALIRPDKGSFKASPKRESAMEFAPPEGEGFSLDSPESVAQQKARFAAEQAKADAKAQREKIAELSAKPIVGRSIETAGDLFDPLAAENPLFASPTPKPRDAIESALKKAIDATDPTKGGQSLEGVTGAPVWLAKSAANGALKIALASYKAGKTIAKAIDDALVWLRGQKLANFNERDAITWLESQIKGGGTAKSEAAAALEADRQTYNGLAAQMRELRKDAKPETIGGILSGEEYQDLWRQSEAVKNKWEGHDPMKVTPEAAEAMFAKRKPAPEPKQAAPIIEGPEGQRRRAFTARVKEGQLLEQETRRAVGNEFYDPRSNADTNAAVNKMIESEGVDSFLNRILTDDPALKGEEKVAGSFQVVKRLDRFASELERAGEGNRADAVRDKVVNTIELISEREGTLAGRSVQAFRMWAAMTPEGIVRDYVARVKRTRNVAIRKHSGESSVEKFIATVRSADYAKADAPTRKRMLQDAAGGGGKVRKAFRSLADELSKITDPAKAEAKIAETLTKALKLPEVDKEFSKSLLRRVESAMKKPSGFQRDYALSQIQGDIRLKLGIAAKDVGTAWWYASILSGPMTQAVNLGASVLNVGANLGILAGLHPGATPSMAAGVVKGLAEGSREAWAILRKGDYTRRESGMFEPATLELAARSPNRLHRALSIGRLVGRAMTAADMVNFKIAEQGIGRMMAWEVAKREGLSGKALTRRVAEILHDTPELRAKALEQAKAEGLTGNDLQRRVYELIEESRPADILERGRDFGLESTFNEKPYGAAGMIGDLASQASGRLAPIRFVVPFTRIVSNVLNEQLNWSPYGYRRAFRGSRPEDARYGKPAPEGDAYRMQLAKATIATVGTAMVYAAAKGGLVEITASGPSDSSKRYQLMETGWKPNSIKVGNAYLSWLNTPMALMFAVIGHRMDAEKYGKFDEKDFLTRASFVLSHAGLSLLDQSFLSGLSDFIGSFKGPGGGVNEKMLAKIVSRTASSFVVPNLVKWVDRVMDPEVTKADTLKEIFLRDLPVARSLTGKPIINALGEPVVREGGDRFGLDRFVTLSKSDPVWDLIVKNQAFVGVPSKNAKIGDRTMEPEEYYEYMKLSGQDLRKLIEKNLPRLQTMKPEQVQKWMKTASDGARDRARATIRSAAFKRELQFGNGNATN